MFFFSSRRRHTRWTGDWSSDVCSSDLLEFGWRGPKWHEPIQIPGDPGSTQSLERLREKISPPFENFAAQLALHRQRPAGPQLRSEERRVGKECRPGKKPRSRNDK